MTARPEGCDWMRRLRRAAGLSIVLVLLTGCTQGEGPIVMTGGVWDGYIVTKLVPSGASYAVCDDPKSQPRTTMVGASCRRQEFWRSVPTGPSHERTLDEALSIWLALDENGKKSLKYEVEPVFNRWGRQVPYRRLIHFKVGEHRPPSSDPR